MITKKRKQLDYQDRLKKDKGYSDAIAQLYDLQHQRSAITAKLEEAQAALNQDGRKTAVQREAEALLSGKSSVTVPRDDIAQLRRELAVTDEAIAMQRRVVGQAESRASNKIRDDLQPEHAALLRDLRDALLAAETAAVAVEQFYDRTDSQVHRTMRFSGFGDFDTQTKRFDAVQRWQAEGEEFDVFKDSVE